MYVCTYYIHIEYLIISMLKHHISRFKYVGVAYIGCSTAIIEHNVTLISIIIFLTLVTYKAFRDC